MDQNEKKMKLVFFWVGVWCHYPMEKIDKILKIPPNEDNRIFINF